MCDTLYCAPARLSPVSFFGKNSDRVPSEPQTLCIVPRRAPAESIAIDGRTFQVKDRGFSFVLSRPSWLWGGEMGVNEKGVAIGNEAVFSKYKPARDGVLGMDILRAALGASPTARDAVDFICCFVEAYEQGGNGSFKGSLYYDNSFIVSDPLGAYIVETAGRRWAWRAADPADSISNAYCIEEDYKRLDTQTRKEIAPVNERAACSDEADPGRKGSKESFKGHVENRFFLRFSRGEERRSLSMSLLSRFAGNKGGEEGKGRPAITGFLDILRSHGPFDPARPWVRHMESLCVHEGLLPPASATTASLAVEYRGPDSAVIWFTGTSYPCLSLYKPILLSGGVFHPLWTAYGYAEGDEKSLASWSRWKGWVAKSRAGTRSLDAGFAAARDRAQESLAGIADRALADLESRSDASSFSVLSQEAGAVIAGWEKDCGI